MKVKPFVATLFPFRIGVWVTTRALLGLSALVPSLYSSLPIFKFSMISSEGTCNREHIKH